MADRSLLALSGLNLAVAGMQTGLGAFLPVYLATHGWHHTEIGFALSLAIVATMASQLPGGALVDALTHKRRAAGVAIIAVALAALTIGVVSGHAWVLAAQITQGAAAAVLTPAIAAITLSLSRHDVLGERFGNNVRFAALGSMAAAGAMGLVGTYSHRAILLAAAGLGAIALLALAGIRGADVAAGPTRTAHAAVLPKSQRTARQSPVHELLLDRRLMVFVAALALFQLGNAALLPIASNGWAVLLGPRTDLVVAGAIMLPQALAAGISPWFGRLAETYGRRLVLLLGFSALPVRALLFATDGNPYLEALWQGLDGITAAAFGVMIPLVVADITHSNGRFNLAMGIVGLVSGVGAAFGNPLAGLLADRFGPMITFGFLAIAGLAAFAVVAILMPETRDPQHAIPPQP